MDGVGQVHHTVSTHDADAQAYFNQGLALYYGFDKPNATVSFRQAEEADPTLAMAYWGEALALGRDINYVPGEGERAEGLAAVKLAMKHAPEASPTERDYILALAKRYPVNGAQTDDVMNQAYSDAMKEVAKRYPDDLDAQVLYAESVMDLHPWKLWTMDGQQTPGTEMIIPTLESVMQRDPNHLGANHFYVHALEGSPHPEKALASAMLLPKLAPKSPHLMHMPSHILIHTGDFFETVKINQAAALLGDAKLSCCGPPAPSDFNYHGHNLRFLIYAANMAGMSKEAVNASSQLNKLAQEEIAASDKKLPYKSDILEYDAIVLSRFGRWKDVLKLSKPDSATPRAVSRYYFGLTVSFAALKDIPSAIRNYSDIDRTDYSMGPMARTEKENLEQAVMANIAGSRIARALGKMDLAVQFAQAAQTSQQAAGYQEPPGLPWPAREELGAVMLAAGNWSGAEVIYHESLKQYPKSGRALLGLSEALRHQGKTAEADQAFKEFQDAWKNADVPLQVSDL